MSHENPSTLLDRGLLMAALARDPQLLLKLLALGADTAKAGARALDLAGSHGWARGVEILAPACAPEAVETCLRGAITHGWVECASLLLPHILLASGDSSWPGLILFAHQEERPEMAHLIDSFAQARVLDRHVPEASQAGAALPRGRL